MTLLAQIKAQCATALKHLYADKEHVFNANDIEVTISTNKAFGHYQCNSAMKLTKSLSVPPRTIAEALCKQILAQQPATDAAMFSEVQVAGPGFINFTLSNSYISKLLNQQLRDPSHGCNKLTTPQKAIVDFSSPNIAKEMHVGHLRSTIIGDSIARILEFFGYAVLRLNHVGDWGTQFGMLIAYLEKEQLALDTIGDMTITQLLNIYRAAKLEFDADAAFKQKAQQAVLLLQQGNQQTIQIWQAICTISRTAFAEIYSILDIKLQERGESFYNPYLPLIIKDLETKHLIQISDRAKCVYIDGFTNREGEPLPLIVQKSDGGYNYATTDIAALKHRVVDENAAWIIYVTDAGQTQHFNMVFAACRMAGYYDPSKVRVDHVPFGLVLRADGKKFQTRAGETEKLIDLINAAINKAMTLLLQRDNTLDTNELQHMATILGINAIKYADLANNRVSDYIFSLDRMLQFEGNTAAFVCYAYVRIQSIKKKIAADIELLKNTTQIALNTPEEIDLGLHVLQFNDALNNCLNELLPNRLTDYLFHLAEKFHSFFHHCKVDGTIEQNSRILLCEAVACILAQGLQLLGLRLLDRM